MRDHGEVGEMLLYARVQDHGRLRVAEGRPVLVQQVHQLLGDHPRNSWVRNGQNARTEDLFSLGEGDSDRQAVLVKTFH